MKKKKSLFYSCKATSSFANSQRKTLRNLISNSKIIKSSRSSGNSDEPKNSGNIRYDESLEDEDVHKAKTQTPNFQTYSIKRWPPFGYSPSPNYLLLIENDEPESYQRRLKSPYNGRTQWKTSSPHLTRTKLGSSSSYQQRRKPGRTNECFWVKKMR